MREVRIKAGDMPEIAVVEDGCLVEYLRDDQANHDAETIYLGKVERIVPGMDAAFVNIGQKKNGFLPLKEKSQTFRHEGLQCGDRVLVQVKREAHEQKGAFLSRDVTLCGQYVILMPCDRYIGISAKIDGEKREALKQLGRALSDDRFGLVMRTAAAEASETLLTEETETLWEKWQTIMKKAATAPAPSVIYEEVSLLDAFLRDYAPRGIDAIVTNDERLRHQFDGTYPVVWTEEDPMEKDHLLQQRKQALGRLVPLPCGGNLVIDECEALTVMDVNSARATGTKMAEENIRKVNIQACKEAARQMRLRNLGGIVIIDLIDMQPESRPMVEEALKQACLKDRVKVVVHGFTSLGLMELTRKRQCRTLRDEWTETCTHCQGSGRKQIKEEKHD